MEHTSILNTQQSQIAAESASFSSSRRQSIAGLGVDQAEALLDAVQAGVGPVDPVLEAHEVFAQMCEVDAQAGDQLLDRCEATRHVGHVRAQGVDLLIEAA